MPGLVQFLTDQDEDLSLDEDGQPENAKLWLPSSIPAEMREIVCSESVDRIEESLRRARRRTAYLASQNEDGGIQKQERSRTTYVRQIAGGN